MAALWEHNKTSCFEKSAIFSCYFLDYESLHLSVAYVIITINMNDSFGIFFSLLLEYHNLFILFISTKI